MQTSTLFAIVVVVASKLRKVGPGAIRREAGIREAGSILSTVPMAPIGGIIALFVAHESWNMSSLVGLIGLFGIAVQNSLVLMTQTRALMSEGHPFREAVREASIGRARPKLMTAATAILGLPPLLVLRLHSTEIEHPLAIVMIGGLITSTSPCWSCQRFVGWWRRIREVHPIRGYSQTLSCRWRIGLLAVALALILPMVVWPH